jgi:hypothetical protein
MTARRVFFNGLLSRNRFTNAHFQNWHTRYDFRKVYPVWYEGAHHNFGINLSFDKPYQYKKPYRWTIDGNVLTDKYTPQTCKHNDIIPQTLHKDFNIRADTVDADYFTVDTYVNIDTYDHGHFGTFFKGTGTFRDSTKYKYMDPIEIWACEVEVGRIGSLCDTRTTPHKYYVSCTHDGDDKLLTGNEIAKEYEYAIAPEDLDKLKKQ